VAWDQGRESGSGVVILRLVLGGLAEPFPVGAAEREREFESFWRLIEPETVDIVWHSGHSGIGMRFAPFTKSSTGSADYWMDVFPQPAEPVVTTVRATRIDCDTAHKSSSLPDLTAVRT